MFFFLQLNNFQVSNYGQQGFCGVGISMMCEKVFKEKNLDSKVLTP